MDTSVPSEANTIPDLSRVHDIYNKYVEARNALLEELQLKGKSNRDPLSEFSEWLVKALVNGTLAENRVQKGWDVLSPTKERIQVKYLANSAGSGVNWHTIQVSEQMDSYALVIFEALLPKGVIIFPVNDLAKVGVALRKRHTNLDTTLQFTAKNYYDILKNVAKFKDLGVRLYVYEQPNWILK
jgi:hypothetical protein